MRPGLCSLPNLLATEGLRSLRTSSCGSHRPNPDQLFGDGTSAPFPALRRWKVLQFSFAPLAVDTPDGLGSVPKTSAPLANFQLHAQFHDGFSVFVPSPDGLYWWLYFRGVKRTRPGNSGSYSPDGGLPPVLPRVLSC